MGETGTGPLVGIVGGSRSDFPVLEKAVAVLDALGVPCELRVVSAHRTPDHLFRYAETAAGRGIRVIVAGAGGAAHLPGMLAAKTLLPVIGVPIPTQHLGGLDSLLSIVQMPRGIPVATVAIGNADNAALLAAAILALWDEGLAARLEAYRAAQTDAVMGDESERRAAARLTPRFALPDRVAARLEREMQAKCIVDLSHQRVRDFAQPGSDAFDSDRPDLLGLCLRIALESGGQGREEDLEGIHAVHVRCHRDDRDHAPPEARGGRVGGVVADDDDRPELVGLRPSHGLEIDRVDLSAPDHDRAAPGSPSPTAGSHAAASPSSAHCSQACS